MDNEVARELLKRALPNFPDSLLEEWLVPYVLDLVPSVTDRGLKILSGRTIDFWQTISWSLEKIDFVDVVQSRLTQVCIFALIQMDEGYFKGSENKYSREIPNGKERTLQALKFIQEHRVFPGRPVFFVEPNGALEILDGNHRILAFILAMKMYPPAADRMQEVWLGRFSDGVSLS